MDLTHPVERFRAGLVQLGPDDYPKGVVPLPGYLPGTAFFSAAAGLVMPPDSATLPPFPYGGVMFVGHNLDAAEAFEKRRRAGRSHGDPSRPMRTWRNLYRLLDAATVATTDCFFTNAYVGLLAGSRPTGLFPGARDPRFRAWCADFLRFQIETMKPRAIATLGVPARRFMGPLVGIDGWSGAAAPTLRVEYANGTRLVALAHPSMYPSSFRRRVYEGEDGLDGEAALLRQCAGS